MFRILWFEFHDWNVLCQSFVSFWIFFKYDSFWNIFFTNNCICLNIRFHDSDSSRTLPSSYWLAPAFLSTKEKEELFIHFKFNRLIQNYSTDLRFVFKSNLHRLLHRLQIWDWFSNQKFYGWIGPDWITQFRILQMSSIVTSCRQLSLWTVDYHRLSSFVIRCHQQSSCDYFTIFDCLWLTLTIFS